MSLIADKPSLYDRLPEVYRQRDEAQSPPRQLRALVDAIDSVMQALADRIGAQYDDLFIESCDDWLIPYLADLVGTSHLAGDPWTLRADVARTVRHRRRKGTLGAVESQVHALTGWAVHAIELRERLAWNMPLNHLRPDAGGASPFRLPPNNDIRTPVRGGTMALRSPAWLSFAGGPFGPFARVADVKPPLLQYEPPVARTAVNLPNLGVFIWRLAAFQTPVSRPTPPRAPAQQVVALPAAPGAASFGVRFELHPQSEPLPLFNTHRFHADDDPPNVAHIDAVPGPMPAARLTTGDPAGRPEGYVEVVTYAGAHPPQPADDAPGLVLHLPQAPFAGQAWRFRGANLCAWEAGLRPPLRPNEIAIDPARGRIAFGVTGANAAAFADPLAQGLRVSTTTGFSGAQRLEGSVGAQPIPRLFEPDPATATVRRVDGVALTLADALGQLPAQGGPLIVEITNSDTYLLDLGAVPGIVNTGGDLSLGLPAPPPGASGRPWTLTIRAASGQRPVIRLRQPLRLRPANIGAGGFALMNVRLQGLYLTRDAGFPANAALVEQAVLNRLQFEGCTLDPGGAWLLDGSPTGGRTPLRVALRLPDDRGLSPADQQAFDQTPQLVLRHCVTGALHVDRTHLLGLVGCIVDAGAGVAQVAPALALRVATGDAEQEWSAPMAFDGLTVFGRSRVERARGRGALFVHRLEVHDNQDQHAGPVMAVRAERDAADILAEFARGGSCIRESWFRGTTPLGSDRLPQHVACLIGPGAPGAPGGNGANAARLRFTDERFGMPGYAQLSLMSDRRIREEGPGADEMGAFGFLQPTHKWKNAGIRLREFMPVGMRALPIAVT